MTTIGPIQPRRNTTVATPATAPGPSPVSKAAVPPRDGDSLSVSDHAAEIARGAQDLRSRLAGASSLASTGNVGALWLDRVNAALERTRGRVDTAARNGTATGSAVRVAYESRLGAVVLSGAFDNINLASPTSFLWLRVRGASGSQDLTFASGTTLQSIAAAVGSFTDQTGVRAELVPGRGVEFRAVQDSLTSFVSVEVVNDGGQVNGGWGVVPR